MDDGVPGSAEVTVMEGSEFNTVSVEVAVDEFKLNEPILLDEGDFRKRLAAGCGGDLRSLDVCNKKIYYTTRTCRYLCLYKDLYNR